MTGQRERAILIPSSLNIESRDRRESTLKVGQIARAAAVFQMNRIVIYRDTEHNDSWFMAMVLRYMETPQYLQRCSSREEKSYAMSECCRRYVGSSSHQLKIRIAQDWRVSRRSSR